MQKVIGRKLSECTDVLSEEQSVFLLLTGFIRAFPNRIGRHMENIEDWRIEEGVAEKISQLSSCDNTKPHPLILYFSAETICVVIQCDNVERHRTYTLDVVYDECESMGYIDARNPNKIKLVLNSAFTVQYGLVAERTFMTLLSFAKGGKFPLQHLYELPV